jgi:hypothetical protein
VGGQFSTSMRGHFSTSLDILTGMLYEFRAQLAEALEKLQPILLETNRLLNVAQQQDGNQYAADIMARNMLETISNLFLRIEELESALEEISEEIYGIPLTQLLSPNDSTNIQTICAA